MAGPVRGESGETKAMVLDTFIPNASGSEVSTATGTAKPTIG